MVRKKFSSIVIGATSRLQFLEVSNSFKNLHLVGKVMILPSWKAEVIKRLDRMKAGIQSTEK